MAFSGRTEKVLGSLKNANFEVWVAAATNDFGIKARNSHETHMCDEVWHRENLIDVEKAYQEFYDEKMNKEEGSSLV